MTFGTFFLAKITDLIHTIPERQERRDDCSSARSEDEVEFFVERALHHAFDLAQDAKGVEAFSSSSVQAQNAARLLG
jgi:hypothetical protein